MLSDEQFLNAALRGTAEQCETVLEECHDRERAETLARLLERFASRDNQDALAWAELLEEMHPGLEVKFRPQAAT